MMTLRTELQRYGLPLLVLLSVLLPRLLLIGGYPATDDGFYVYSAMTMHHSLAAGQGLPYHGMLLLYPMLLSWVFSFEANPFFALRFVDMLVACVSALCLYRLLAQESRSRIAGALLAAAFMFTLNTYPFIQSGFRNSQFAAYIPLLLALSLALHKPAQTMRDWFLCGALIAACVLLRENFVYFAVYGTLCLYFWKGWRPSAAFVIGGMVTGILVLGTVILLRGGIEGLLLAYQEMGVINDVQLKTNIHKFLRNFDIAKGVAHGAIVLAVTLFVCAIWTKRKSISTDHLRRMAFWFGLALIPLIEPLFKRGVIYHYSVCLIGLACLAAFSWLIVKNWPKTRLRFLGAGLAVVFCVMNIERVEEMTTYFQERTLPNIALWQQKTWSEEAIHISRYLTFAEYIKKAMPAEGGHLSVSGNLYGLYVLTDSSPPSDALKNLSLLTVSRGEEKLRQALAECPPDVVYVTLGDYRAGGAGQIIESLPEYHRVAKFEKDPKVDYGHFGGGIYVLDEQNRKTCKGD